MAAACVQEPGRTGRGAEGRLGQGALGWSRPGPSLHTRVSENWALATYWAKTRIRREVREEVWPVSLGTPLRLCCCPSGKKGAPDGSQHPRRKAT